MLHFWVVCEVKSNFFFFTFVILISIPGWGNISAVKLESIKFLDISLLFGKANLILYPFVHQCAVVDSWSKL